MLKTEIIVDYSKDSNFAAKIKRYGKIKYFLPSINSFVVELSTEILSKLNAINNKACFNTSIPIYAQMNNVISELSINKIHSHNITGKDIGIAVLDTGISPVADFIYPKNRIVGFVDFVNNIPYPYDDNGHGSHVSGICSGNGYLSHGKYKGIAPESNIISVKILDKNGQGNSTQALAGIQWIIDNRKKYNIKIANLSIGSSEKNMSLPLSRALEAAWDSGITVVVAAGNNNTNNNAIYESKNLFSKIIVVDSLPSNKKICALSKNENTHIYTYGTDIISCMSPNYRFNTSSRSRNNIVGKNYIKMSGTSMATPVVSGTAALLLQKNPNLTPDQIKNLIIKSGGNNRILNIKNLF